MEKQAIVDHAAGTELDVAEFVEAEQVESSVVGDDARQASFVGGLGENQPTPIHQPAMWGTPNGGRPGRYGRTFGYAHSQLQRTNIVCVP